MTAEETALALKRLGANKDAGVLIDLLYAELQGVSGPGLDDGALRHREGRRNFASELIARLTPDEPGMKSGRTDANSTDAEPGSRRAAGAGRRVPDTDPRRYPKRG